MRAPIIALALFTLAPVPPMAAFAGPPVEDEAHRLDRLETKRLNERAAAQRPARPDVSTRTEPRARSTAAAAPESADEAALRRREMAAIAAWRERIELCRRGVHTMC